MSDGISIADTMRAIRALHPCANVNVYLMAPDGWAGVAVSRLPDDLFGADIRDDDYARQIHWYTLGGYISVSRYCDGDLLAAAETALNLIAEYTSKRERVIA
jgi:hypothetical protein